MRSGEWNSGPSADQMRRQEQQASTVGHGWPATRRPGSVLLTGLARCMPAHGVAERCCSGTQRWQTAIGICVPWFGAFVGEPNARSVCTTASVPVSLATLKTHGPCSSPPKCQVLSAAPPATCNRSTGQLLDPSAAPQVLNAWTQERLMQLAAGGTMVLVLVLLFAAGGPPSDARCTLPWC